MRLPTSLAVALVLATPTFAQFPAKGKLDSAEKRTLDFAGIEHHYLIQTASGREGHPAVILLHAGNETAADVWVETSLPTLAARDHFILVAPDATANQHWNDGRGAALNGQASSADDIGYLKQLIAEVIKHDHADPQKIFMVGSSNGGFMTMRFACQVTRYLRAAANVNSELPNAQAANCSMPQPLAWLSMNGDRDPIVPFNGMKAGTMVNGQAQPGLQPATVTFTFFADAAGCSPDVQTETLPHTNTANNSTAERRIRHKCASGHSSVEYILHNAGHTWPGTPPSSETAKLGGVNDDIDAGTVIWDHFQRTLMLQTFKPAS